MDTAESIPNAPSQNDRIMAALAHVSALLPFWGVIAPIVIWVTQKDKSRFVAFQALQALAYQISMILAGFVGMACYMCSFFVMFVPLMMASSSEQSSAPPGPLFVKEAGEPGGHQPAATLRLPLRRQR